jgi:uncharacterized repeat protein (TIGR01451 family)
MKINLIKLYLILIPMIFTTSGYSQEIQSALSESQVLELNNNNITLFQSLGKDIASITSQLVSCTADTIEYPFFKTTGLRALSINNSTSASAASQYYDTPQPLTISGFEFYAWSTSAPTSNTIVPVTCEVYLAGPDSIPTGIPLASIVVQVDTVFGGGSLAVIRKTATFNTPIVVTAPYVVVLTNNSSNNIAVVCNDYAALPADGGNEWLSSVVLANNWIRSYDIIVGGNFFDADWLIHPFVSYDLDADFTFLETGLNVDFMNAVPPVINNRMYNQAAAQGNTDLSHEWDFGDMSMLVNEESPSHLYGAQGPYNVTLTETVFGWRRNCVDIELMQVLVNESDISVLKTDDLDETYSGTTSTYTIIVTNNGPEDDPAVLVTDVMPMGLIAEYTSSASGGASGNTLMGSDDINDNLSMPAGSSVTYTVEAFIEAGTTGTILNTATATGTNDPNGINDSMTDETIILGVIPTLSEWGMLLLSLLFIIIGVRAMQVRREYSFIR